PATTITWRPATRMRPRWPTSTNSCATICAARHRRERWKSVATAVEFHALGGEEAGRHLDELAELYAEVYAEPPYEWGDDHAALFKERFEGQRQQAGFSLVEARDDGQLVGVAFGVTLQ